MTPTLCIARHVAASRRHSARPLPRCRFGGENARQKMRSSRDDDDWDVAAAHESLGGAAEKHAIEMPPAVRTNDDSVGALAAGGVDQSGRRGVSVDDLRIRIDVDPV